MCVGGSIQTRTWEGQDGKKNYVTEVIVSEAHFTGDRRDSNGSANSQSAPMGNFTSAPSAVENEFITVDDDQLPF